MADQQYIQGIIKDLSGKMAIAQKEAIEGILKLVEGKTNTQALQILNDLNIDQVMKAKTSNIVSGYTSGNAGLLLAKQIFAEISEADLLALITQSERYLAGEITAMSNVIRQEVFAGIMNKSTVDDIIQSLGKKGYAADVGMKRVISDGLNNYSRSVTRMMMEEAPDETKYIYIGPADDRTRDFCLSAIQAGAITKDQIESMGWGFSLTEGGGINCRHGWEPMSRDVRAQFYRQEEAEELINA